MFLHSSRHGCTLTNYDSVNRRNWRSCQASTTSMIARSCNMQLWFKTEPSGDRGLGEVRMQKEVASAGQGRAFT